MHCFFHLVNGNVVIPDETGIEVSSLAAAQCLAHQAVREMREATDQIDGEWRGWRLNVVCSQGSILASICLNTYLQ